MILVILPIVEKEKWQRFVPHLISPATTPAWAFIFIHFQIIIMNILVKNMMKICEHDSCCLSWALLSQLSSRKFSKVVLLAEGQQQLWSPSETMSTEAQTKGSSHHRGCIFSDTHHFYHTFLPYIHVVCVYIGTMAVW